MSVRWLPEDIARVQKRIAERTNGKADRRDLSKAGAGALQAGDEAGAGRQSEPARSDQGEMLGLLRMGARRDHGLSSTGLSGLALSTLPNPLKNGRVEPIDLIPPAKRTVQAPVRRLGEAGGKSGPSKGQQATAASRLRKSSLEAAQQLFITRCTAYGLPAPTPELRFDPVRRWRFDYAWPHHPRKDGYRLAIECDGGVYTKGRHVRPQGFLNDRAKFNAAQLQGWLVLSFEPSKLYSALPEIKRALGC